jgi:hypothetical protein
LIDATSNDFFGAASCAEAVAIPTVRTTSQLTTLRMADLRIADIAQLYAFRKSSSRGNALSAGIRHAIVISFA